MKKEQTPVIGEQYHFFDDGKIRESRHYMATVVDKITPEQSKDIYMNYQGMNMEAGMTQYNVILKIHTILLHLIKVMEN